jgi:hypothetical protein
MIEEERKGLLADEWLIVRNSGEIPEITFHATLHYLTEDTDGPGLLLTQAELDELKDAAVKRYQEIILRDMNIENFHKSLYRGLRRSLFNWHRFVAFRKRQSIQADDFKKIAAKSLLLFLEQGMALAGQELPRNFINCSVQELTELAEEFGVAEDQLPSKIEQFCL